MSNKEELIYDFDGIGIKESATKLVLSFDPSIYRVSKDSVERSLSRIIAIGEIQDFSVDNVEAGEIIIYFNPELHNAGSRVFAVVDMIFKIKRDCIGIDTRKLKTLKKIKITMSDTELVFNYDPSEYGISRKKALEVISSIIMIYGLEGYSVDDVESGEIIIYFDPEFHTFASLDEAIENMLSAIRDSAI